jgi:transketolase
MMNKDLVRPTQIIKALSNKNDEYEGGILMFAMDKISTREAFGVSLLQIAEANPNVIAIGADTTKSMGMGPMEKKYPGRVFNIGIAEQNMMGVAAGMAATGMKVYAASYSPFTCMRACEQVRTFIAYPNLNVTIVGAMGGLSGSIEGVTHQGLEDIAIMRAIPNMKILVPADAASIKVITAAVAQEEGPVYIRVGKGPVRKVFNEDYQFEMGKANVLIDDGNDATVICNGFVVGRVLEARQILTEKGYKLKVIEMPCVKPLDRETVIQAAEATKVVITVEDHNIIGGLGSAVAETLSENCPVRLKRMGIADVFTESGPHEELLDKYGLSVENIVKTVEVMVR